MTPMTRRQILEELETQDIAGFSLVGALLGGTLGFVVRPAAIGVGQLPLATVLSRGTNLEGLGLLLMPVAQTSFNLLLGGAALGAVTGGVVCYWLIQKFAILPISTQRPAKVSTKKARFAMIGALVGIPLSYYFQSGIVRAKLSLPEYLTHISSVADQGAEFVVPIALSVGVFALLGGILGRFMEGQAQSTTKDVRTPED